MAYVERAGLGPTFLEVQMLKSDAQTTSALIVATTDDDAEAPPVTNCYWIKEAPGLAAHAFTVGPGALPVPTPLNFEWPVCAAHRIEAVVDFGLGPEENVCRFDMDGGGGFCTTKYDPQSNTTFRYRLTQQGGNNAYGSARDTNVSRSLRWQFDGTNYKLWVDGVLDISIGVTDMPLNFLHVGTNIVNAKQYWCGLGWRGSDDEADRPNTTPTIEGSNPKGDNESASFSDENCNGADGAGTWPDWDDDGADDSNTAIAMCDDANTAASETSDMDDIVMDDPDLVVLRQLGAAIFGGKTGATFARIINGDMTPKISEAVHTNVSNTSFRGYSRAFPLDANGDAWTKLRVNDTNAGIRALGTNDESTAWAMNRMETFKWGDDPPAVGKPSTQALII
jgi:hypothetical protein